MRCDEYIAAAKLANGTRVPLDNDEAAHHRYAEKHDHHETGAGGKLMRTLS
jgi:hypothetical protein